MRDGQLYVDGEPADEPYVKHLGLYPQDNFGPERVEPGKIFCMGDNRDKSRDSRWFGGVRLGLIIAKADILYFSWQWDWNAFLSLRWGQLQAPRITRVGKLLTRT